jgi:hypothetical protein
LSFRIFLLTDLLLLINLLFICFAFILFFSSRFCTIGLPIVFTSGYFLAEQLSDSVSVR